MSSIRAVSGSPKRCTSGCTLAVTVGRTVASRLVSAPDSLAVAQHEREHDDADRDGDEQHDARARAAGALPHAPPLEAAPLAPVEERAQHLLAVVRGDEHRREPELLELGEQPAEPAPVRVAPRRHLVRAQPDRGERAPRRVERPASRCPRSRGSPAPTPDPGRRPGRCPSAAPGRASTPRAAAGRGSRRRRRRSEPAGRSRRSAGRAARARRRDCRRARRTPSPRSRSSTSQRSAWLRGGRQNGSPPGEVEVAEQAVRGERALDHELDDRAHRGRLREPRPAVGEDAHLRPPVAHDDDARRLLGEALEDDEVVAPARGREPRRGLPVDRLDGVARDVRARRRRRRCRGRAGRSRSRRTRARSAASSGRAGRRRGRPAPSPPPRGAARTSSRGGGAAASRRSRKSSSAARGADPARLGEHRRRERDPVPEHRQDQVVDVAGDDVLAPAQQRAPRARPARARGCRAPRRRSRPSRACASPRRAARSTTRSARRCRPP